MKPGHYIDMQSAGTARERVRTNNTLLLSNTGPGAENSRCNGKTPALRQTLRGIFSFNDNKPSTAILR